MAMKNNAVIRALWIISGILLLIAGVYILINPAAGVASMALLLGIIMLLSGIVDIVVFARWHKLITGAGWIFADGILTIVLSLFLMFNQILAAAALPLIFSMWLLFTGISRIVGSVDIKKAGVRGWGWFLALGIIVTVLGIVSLFEPLATLITMTILVGLNFIVQGAVYIISGLFSKRLL